MEHLDGTTGGLLVGATSLALSLVVSGHAVLTRRDGRNAIGWVGLVWLVPLLGALLYVAFGINRIRRRASALRLRKGTWSVDMARKSAAPPEELGIPELAAFGDRLTQVPLTGGNAVVPLVDGDEAYPAMLAAIDAAQHSVSLTTYIFDHDSAGLRFVDALTRAHERGVAVRVLVDAVGARYSWPKRSVVELLQDRGVSAARFNPSRSPFRLRYMNLRSHRKVLVVDGRHGFTGGMNIREGCVLGSAPEHPTRDLHFSLRGPVVLQLQESFVEDWWFSTGEQLVGGAWWPRAEVAGHASARTILDGPDGDLDKLRRTLLGALSVARSHVRIATPYFLPDPELVAAMDVAVLRGVTVDLLLPGESNLRLVQWAMNHALDGVLARGCRVWLSPAPFDHSKLMTVDGCWTLLGSGNWDPRSLRLNFELNVEVHGRDCAERVEAIFEERRATARRLTRLDLRQRGLALRVRDGVAALFTPYL